MPAGLSLREASLHDLSIAVLNISPNKQKDGLKHSLVRVTEGCLHQVRSNACDWEDISSAVPKLVLRFQASCAKQRTVVMYVLCSLCQMKLFNLLMCYFMWKYHFTVTVVHPPLFLHIDK